MISLFLSLVLLYSVGRKHVTSFQLSAETLRKEVGGRFMLQKHLGSGTYGRVYSAIDINSNQRVAVKLEKITTTIAKKKIYREDLALDLEYRRYKSLDGVGKLYYFH